MNAGGSFALNMVAVTVAAARVAVSARLSRRLRASQVAAHTRALSALESRRTNPSQVKRLASEP